MNLKFFQTVESWTANFYLTRQLHEILVSLQLTILLQHAKYCLRTKITLSYYTDTAYGEILRALDSCFTPTGTSGVYVVRGILYIVGRHTHNHKIIFSKGPL